MGGTARVTGARANWAGLAVGVSCGTFDVGGAATIASLYVTDKGVLAVTLDGGAAGTALTVTGHASFDEDSKLQLKLSSIEEAEGEHIVVTAGSLSGADNLTTRSEEQTSELQSSIRSSYVVFCVTKKKNRKKKC